MGLELNRRHKERETFVEYNGQKIHIQDGIYYTKDHMWVEVMPNSLLKVGVTDFAQKFLREKISLVELDTLDPSVKEGEKFGCIYGSYYRVIDTREYECTAFDLTAPVKGKIVEVNNKIMDKPELINKDPYEEGWIVIIRPDDPEMLLKGLIKPQDYKRLLSTTGKSPFRVI